MRLRRRLKTPSTSSTSSSPRALAALVTFWPVVTSGCAHEVRIESNVPQAQVRVDGERLGTVEEGATFKESGGIGAHYDLEVQAPGYRIERRTLVPKEPDPVLGIPAVCATICTCSMAGCLSPGIALLTAVTIDPNDVESQAIGYGSALGLLGLAGASAVVAAFGVNRLPDVVTVDLEPAPELGGALLPLAADVADDAAPPTIPEAQRH